MATSVFPIFLKVFFGGGMQASRPDPRGDDLRFDLEITLDEAATGVERTLRVPHLTPCGKCEGRGSNMAPPSPVRHAPVPGSAVRSPPVSSACR